MSATNEHDPDSHDGYLGISRAKLEAMAESELAQWQANHKDEPALFILAEREWQRRIISHQLKEQFDLDARLARAAESHAESLADGNHWWAIAATAIGVVGTLAGVWLGKYLESSSLQASAQQAQTQSASPAVSQPPIPSNGATSAASSTTSKAAKKTP